ncbi:hypothetical protein ACWEQ7_12860 [Streptomyces sp. NPDC004069]
MIMTRSKAVTAAVSAAAALVATGITYATAAPAPEAAPAAVQQAPAPAYAPMGGEGGQGGQGKGNEGGGGGGRGGEGGEGKHGKRHHEIGRIYINEREYSAHPDGCITVVSGLGSTSFNIRNDSKHRVEFFRGATCDNGAPVATVGPWSDATNVRVEHVRGGVHVKHGVVGSFRVVKRHHGGGGDDYDDF